MEPENPLRIAVGANFALGRLPRCVVAVLLVALTAAVGGCGGSSAGSTTTTSVPEGQAAVDNSNYSGAEATPPKQAPEPKLTNYFGEPVDLVKTAQAELGARAKDMQIVAGSTDPRGDNAKTVAAFLEAHGITGRMQHLIGSRQELGRVWSSWNIVAKPEKAGRDLVEHSALVYGIAADGKITALYPADFDVSQIVHNVPLLERQ